MSRLSDLVVAFLSRLKPCIGRVSLRHPLAKGTHELRLYFAKTGGVNREVVKVFDGLQPNAQGALGPEFVHLRTTLGQRHQPSDGPQMTGFRVALDVFFRKRQVARAASPIPARVFLA